MWAQQLYLLACNAVQSVQNQTTFGRIYRLHPNVLTTCFMLVSRMVYFLTMKTEAAYSSERSVDFWRSTRRHVPEDIVPRRHRWENLKFYKNVEYLYETWAIRMLTAELAGRGTTGQVPETFPLSICQEMQCLLGNSKFRSGEIRQSDGSKYCHM
jgi:hypothetical protein